MASGLAGEHTVHNLRDSQAETMSQTKLIMKTILHQKFNRITKFKNGISHSRSVLRVQKEFIGTDGYLINLKKY